MSDARMTSGTLSTMPQVERLADALADLQTLVNRADSRIAHDLGVGQGHDLQTLRLLSSTPGLRVSDIARRQSVSTATASARVDRLERRGFVERLRADHDRRVVRVALTGAGKIAARKSIRLRRRILDDVADPVGAAGAIAELTARYRQHLDA